MDDVYLEGTTPDGPAVVGHLSVIVDTEGITFLGPDPGERRTVAWERATPLEFGPPAALPDGQPVTSLQFVVDGRPLRILVPPKDEPHDSEEHGFEEHGSFDEHGLEEVGSEELGSEELGSEELGSEEFAILDDVVGVAPAALAALVELPPPSRAEPPEPTLVQPPAPLLAQPPAPVLAEPPAPVLAEPPPPVLPEPSALVDELDDTFVTAPRVEEQAGGTDEATPVRLPTWLRYASHGRRGARRSALTSGQRLGRLVLFTVLVGLIPIAAGTRYFQTHQPSGHITGVALTDTAIAGRVGIQPGDLPGWSAAAPRTGDVFAAGATTGGSAALGTAQQASTVMARCLHVPVAAVEGALGMGAAGGQVSAEVVSPSYADPAGNGGAVNSVVDVMKTPQIQAADASVFQDPALFATCYQPYVQAMLPYTAGAAGAGFATATVQPLVVPVPAGPGAITVAGFQIARIANADGQTKTVISTATAVFGGRVQATLGTVSDLVFSLSAQDQLVRALETRTIGVAEL
jgi:hypothetical protein